MMINLKVPECSMLGWRTVTASKIEAKLIDLVSSSSLSRLRTISRRGDIILNGPIRPQPVYAHWMALILVSGESLRITFKSHFDTRTAKFFAARTYEQAPDKISDDRALDFFREFCNMTAGHLKLIFAENEVRVGVSLPALARGFDEIYYVRPANSATAGWALKCGDERVLCSTHVERFREFQLENVDLANGLTSGKVDFL